nr:immunoglobulin light chain junction region [Macaca mulatta]MOY06681.1 immunoglobulin light chain junction region [Macaca mulatta]MOY08015.1 immunoglobulin light chain junction region [Macaca mulatta]
EYYCWLYYNGAWVF